MRGQKPWAELLAIRPDLADVNEADVRGVAERNGLELVGSEGLFALRSAEHGSMVYGMRNGVPDAQLWHCLLFLTMP